MMFNLIKNIFKKSQVDTDLEVGDVVSQDTEQDLSQELSQNILDAQRDAAHELYMFYKETTPYENVVSFENLIKNEMGNFNDESLAAWIENGIKEDENDLRNVLLSYADKGSDDSYIKEFIDNFKSIRDDVMNNSNIISGEYKAAKVVENINSFIKKIAFEDSSFKKDSIVKQADIKTGKKYNLKEAQYYIYGPENARYDPFFKGRGLVSDMQFSERNRGFGGSFGDVVNFDWESFWRGNIMDKYSRDYKDTETGKWVGGYLRKRFEIDDNIPEANDLQLKPGSRRRPILNEYGLIEGRLACNRSKNKDEYHSETTDTSYFDWNGKGEWKEVDEKMTKRVAYNHKTTIKQSGRPPKDPFEIGEFRLPGEKKQKPLTQMCECPHCKSTRACDDTTPCPNCGAADSPSPKDGVTQFYKHRPFYPGEGKRNTDQYISTGTPLNTAKAKKDIKKYIPSDDDIDNETTEEVSQSCDDLAII